MRWAVLAGLFVAASAQGQITITTNPAHPVAGVPFVVHIVIATCSMPGAATVNGSHIDIPFTAVGLCPATPSFVALDVSVPGVPAGSYTIRLVSAGTPEGFASAPVVVGADVPAFDPRLLATLAVALIVLALLRLRS